MKKILCAAALFLATISLHATPLRLDYTLTDLGGGTYSYAFELTLDNHDASFAPGQGFGWLIFGDEPSPHSFPFTMTSPIPGPWSTVTTSSGAHNGPTFYSPLVEWYPTVGASLFWSGTSTFAYADGSLLFSTIYSNERVVGADFEVAHRVDFLSNAVPDANQTSGLLALALIGTVALRRRFR